MIIDAPKNTHILALRALWREAFGDTDAFLDIFFETAFSPARSRALTENGELLAALYWFDCEINGAPLAYLYAIATAKAHRGKGLCTTLMKNTHKHLASRGYAYAVLVPGEASLFDFYRKMGYTAFSPARILTALPDGAPLSLKSLMKDEYAARRRTLLPAGGVVQEKENLDFLLTEYTLYAAENTLVTARTENGILYATELLGDKDLAPRILSTLGCKEGRFRIAGGEAPLAMYLPLKEDGGVPPSYFGLAFD